jgi:glycosyltransferase involved in cell wall biosynthesis
MVSISISTKIYAFHLAEQIARQQQLDNLFTSFAWSKNTFARRFVKRIDKEEIPVQKIHTFILLAFPMRLFPGYSHIWNEMFDRWVSKKLNKTKSRVFIGWSGMSLQTIRKAKGKGMITILERSSSHILFQNEILQEEYKKFGIDFSIHPSVIKKELLEYQEADMISIPSDFVRDSFIAQGFDQKKLMVNPFGANKYFTSAGREKQEPGNKFRIVYMGTLSIRKGLIYLFQALGQLKIPMDQFEVWFLGSVDNDIRSTIAQYKKENWTFYGHINHYDLQSFLVKCDVGVQPSVEEGLSMVIPQMMSCGIVPIVTTNTGGGNIIKSEISGFVIPIRDPEIITEKIYSLFYDRERLNKMSEAAVSAVSSGFTWDDYGDRYMKNILNLASN